jgi:hypothetical protein
MLDATRKNGLARERLARLEVAISEAGGVPTPMNCALSEQTIHRALSAANFEAARRYDGVRTEDASSINLIRRDRLTEGGRATVASLPVREKQGTPSRHEDLRHERETLETSVQSIGSAAKEKASFGISFVRPTSSSPMPKQKARGTKVEAVLPENHPAVLLGAKLIEKNKKIWDPKTQRQTAQIYALLAKILIEQSVFEIADVRQSHFADLDDLLANVAKSYGKSPKDLTRTTTELRAIGASQSPDERGLAPETINRHLTFLSQLLPFMRGRGIPLAAEI